MNVMSLSQLAPPPPSTRILVVDDDDRTLKALVFLLQRHGYTTEAASDGQAALDILIEPDPPSIVLLDWDMPKLDGLDVCRLLRSIPIRRYIYVIMVTARDSPADLLLALNAGADDFLGKPADKAHLLARIRSGERVLALEERLEDRITALEKTLEEVRQLKRLLPICMYCKKIRDDDDYWQEIESYIHVRTGTDFSHGICPDCLETALRDCTIAPTPTQTE